MKTSLTTQSRTPVSARPSAFSLILLLSYFILHTSSLAHAQPVITAQPTNQLLASGTTARFAVSATGTAPIYYQWLFDGTVSAGHTSSVLSLANPQPAQWGFYSVIVSNASGSVTSQVAELKVFVPALHDLSGIQAQTNGNVSLTFSGGTTASFAPYYDLYPLESSPDLVNWAPLATLQTSNAALNALTFLDTNAPEFTQRFYRTATNQLPTPDPQPTGPYPVGTFSMLLTNAKRNNAQFMVTFWYPAVAQAGVLPAKYVDPQVALPAASEEYAYYNFGNVGGGNFDNQAAAFYSHSQPNALLATSPATFPVVLYESGGAGHRRENTDKMEDLASWGYVVVGLDTSDSAVSVFPNGTVVDGQTVDFTSTFLGADFAGRVLDLQYVLDELESLNAGGPPLGGRLNLDEVGAVGWSFGGGAVAELCQQEPRCKAGVVLEPFGMVGTNLQNLLTQPLNVPFLFFRSDYGPDPLPGYDVQGDGRPDGRFEIYNEQVTNAYWVRLASSVHGNFGDYDLIVNSTALEDQWGTPLSGQLLPAGRTSQIVRGYLLSFFNKFLQGEDDHLLDGPSPAYPEVMQFLSTSSISAPPEYPTAALVPGTNGNFYGTTGYGGANGDGTVFQVTTNGTLTTLVSFNGTNGSHPVAGMVLGSDGNFYGTTEYGGTNGNNGTVFQMTPVGALTTLVSFNGTNGSHPAAGLVQGSNGNLYGTTALGGTNGFGTVFETTYAGLLTTLVSFNGNNGISPLAALVQGSDGNFYGTTFAGGSSSQGTVFKMTNAGGLTSLVSFSGGNGKYPAGGLVQGTNGYFYGTASIGGNLSANAGEGAGIAFKLTSAGALTTLVSFNLNNGYMPSGTLIQGSDGNFYGSTEGGGAGGGGTVFRMTAAGALTTLVSFNGTNGSQPPAGLVQGTDGNFYGTTEYGGPGGGGTVFQMTSAGALTNLVSFGVQTNLP